MNKKGSGYIIIIGVVLVLAALFAALKISGTLSIGSNRIIPLSNVISGEDWTCAEYNGMATHKKNDHLRFVLSVDELAGSDGDTLPRPTPGYYYELIGDCPLEGLGVQSGTGYASRWFPDGGGAYTYVASGRCKAPGTPMSSSYYLTYHVNTVKVCWHNQGIEAAEEQFATQYIIQANDDPEESSNDEEENTPGTVEDNDDTSGIKAFWEQVKAFFGRLFARI
jgi:hypothetical protein